MTSNTIKSHIISILVLPFNVIIIIPFLLSRYVKEITIVKDVVYFKYIAGIFLIVGLILIMQTITLFWNKGKGTLAPWNPTQKLVIQGPYKYCRNPMITGVLCILLAQALWFNNYILLIWMLLFFIISTIYFIVKEEPDLKKRFGEDYARYKQNVPRWIPKLKPYK